MFFLLASFMLVSLSMMKLKGLKDVKLPGARTGVQENKPDFITVSITEGGDVGVDEEQVNPASLVDKLKQRVEADVKLKRESRVYINADNRATFQSVAETLDKVRSANITKIVFAIQTGGPGSAPPPPKP